MQTDGESLRAFMRIVGALKIFENESSGGRLAHGARARLLHDFGVIPCSEDEATTIAALKSATIRRLIKECDEQDVPALR